MKRIAMVFAGLLTALSSGSAGAWSHASSFGGHSSGSYGSGGEHSNAFGGSTSGGAGQGMTHDNAYGGSTSANANGAEHSNAYGGSTSANAYGAEHSNAYGGSSAVDANGAEHTNMYGGTTAANSNEAYHSGAYGTTEVYGSTAYHAPVLRRGRVSGVSPADDGELLQLELRQLRRLVDRRRGGRRSRRRCGGCDRGHVGPQRRMRTTPGVANTQAARRECLHRRVRCRRNDDTTAYGDGRDLCRRCRPAV